MLVRFRGIRLSYVDGNSICPNPFRSKPCCPAKDAGGCYRELGAFFFKFLRGVWVTLARIFSASARPPPNRINHPPQAQDRFCRCSKKMLRQGFHIVLKRLFRNKIYVSRVAVNISYD